MMEQTKSSDLNSLDGKLYDHEMEQTRIYNEFIIKRAEWKENNFP